VPPAVVVVVVVVDDELEVVDVVDELDVELEVDELVLDELEFDDVELDDVELELVIPASPTPDATDAATKPQTAMSAMANPLAIRRLPFLIPTPQSERRARSRRFAAAPPEARLG
jgi:hypothetical protein